KTEKKHFSNVLSLGKKIAEYSSKLSDEEYRVITNSLEDIIEQKKGRAAEENTSSRDLFKDIRPEDITDGDLPRKRGRGKSSRMRPLFEPKRKKRRIDGTGKNIAELFTVEETHEQRNSSQYRSRSRLTSLPRLRRSTISSGANEDTAGRPDDTESERSSKRRKLNPSHSRSRSESPPISQQSTSGSDTDSDEEQEDDYRPSKRRNHSTSSLISTSSLRLRRSTSASDAKNEVARVLDAKQRKHDESQSLSPSTPTKPQKRKRTFNTFTNTWKVTASEDTGDRIVPERGMSASPHPQSDIPSTPERVKRSSSRLSQQRDKS
ncbi:hypothetical protein BGX34_006526, partial [Mortierella sp. NVP85]